MWHIYQDSPNLWKNMTQAQTYTLSGHHSQTHLCKDINLDYGSKLLTNLPSLSVAYKGN